MTPGKPMPMRLNLIRHGEDGAREVAQRPRSIPVASVLTSPLQRAPQIGAQARLDPTPNNEPGLTERDNGEDVGSPPSKTIQSRPDWNLFRDDSPHCETLAEIPNRADRLLACLPELAGNVALFSHHRFDRALDARWIGLSAEQAQHSLPSTASLSVLCSIDDRIYEPAVALGNSAAHETFDQEPNQGAGDARPMKQLVIERWENEGGEIAVPDEGRE